MATQYQNDKFSLKPWFIQFISRYWAILLFLVVWQAWVVINAFNPIVAVGPFAVLSDLINHPEIYLSNMFITFVVALGGLASGMILGSLLAIASWFSRFVSAMLTPLAVMFASVPVVVLIPIFARLFGFNITTSLFVVVVITFFPSFVFTSSGLRSLPPGSEDLFRVLGAGRLTVLWRLALPAALPNMAIALRLSASHAVLAAMVAEFLMGTTGLGFLFAQNLERFATERAFGAGLVATIASVAMFLVANAIESHIHRRWT